MPECQHAAVLEGAIIKNIQHIILNYKTTPTNATDSEDISCTLTSVHIATKKEESVNGLSILLV